jgi:riboflavin synthase
MFTGLIQTIGMLSEVRKHAAISNLTIETDVDFIRDVQSGASISVNGACLTATQVNKDGFAVDAVLETLIRTTIPGYRTGRKVNLEKPLRLSDRLDGHIVQGHVDGTGRLIKRTDTPGNSLFTFRLPGELIAGVAPKGSIAIDGVSLTVAELKGELVTVTIVPFTLQHTTFGSLKINDEVNIETDIIGKYVAKLLQKNDSPSRSRGIAPWF